jgi:acyl-CoA reductase-like NAD-dependent aldehyde dehydrogenase
LSLLETAPKVDRRPVAVLDSIFEPIVDTVAGDVPTVGLLIDGTGQSASTGDTFEVVSPIDGSVIAHAQKGGVEDVERAIASAKEARSAIRDMPAAERIAICEDAAGIMRQHADAFADVVTVDLGKTTKAARSETDTTIQRLQLVREEVRKIFGEYLPGDWMPGTVGKRGIVLREPVGTVAAIGPFNYPLFIPAAKIIPAIAGGNSVVAKAPSDDPLPLLMFARVLEEAGLPPGALNVVTGPGGELGDALATSDDVGMVSFTGSTRAGKALARAAGPKPIHLELGGNAAAVVLADADLDATVPQTVSGALKGSGQRCSAVSRVLVVDELYDEYVAAALEQARDWVVGDPRADGVDIGPLVHDRAADNVEALVADAVEKGAELAHGGGRDGTYHEPTVLVDVPRTADIVWEETFGPVLTVVRVADEAEAIEVANGSRYGLDSAVFTRDLDAAWRVASALEVGMVAVNAAPSHGVGHFPFGGRTPDSGVGREGLGYSIDESSALKTVVLPD